MNVDDLVREAFDCPREPRSDEYKAGIKAVLDWRISGARIHCLYLELARRDAFYAGCDEGHRIANSKGLPRRSKYVDRIHG